MGGMYWIIVVPRMETTNTDGFPEPHLNPKELIYFRSWQGAGLTRIFYYASLFFLLFQAIIRVIMISDTLGWKGFLVSSVSSFMNVVVGALGVRILCEIIMAIFSIRESLASNNPA